MTFLVIFSVNRVKEYFRDIKVFFKSIFWFNFGQGLFLYLFWIYLITSNFHHQSIFIPYSILCEVHFVLFWSQFYSQFCANPSQFRHLIPNQFSIVYKGCSYFWNYLLQIFSYNLLWHFWSPFFSSVYLTSERSRSMINGLSLLI